MSVQFLKPLLCSSDLAHCLVWDLDDGLFCSQKHLYYLLRTTSWGHSLEFLLGIFWFIGSPFFFGPSVRKWEFRYLFCCTLTWPFLCLGPNGKRTQKKSNGFWPHPLWTTFSLIREENASFQEFWLLQAHGSLGIWGVKGQKRRSWTSVLFEY